MKHYNIILLVDAAGENILMCYRRKPPYQGLYNLVGGKAERGEDGLHAAYRELREETGVTVADVTLTHLATFTYAMGGAGLPAYDLQSYAGRLRREVEVQGEENPLRWMPLTENFFDMTRFAGEGSIGHVVECVRRYCPELIELRKPAITITPLTEEALPVLAYYRGCGADDLRPMLAESAAKAHKGRYYEQFMIRQEGCIVGTASLYAHADGTVSDGIEVFPPFRRCGFAAFALEQLCGIARERGYDTLTAQVRTGNAASIALHRRLGFRVTRTYMNSRGHEVHDMTKSLIRRAPVCHEMSLRPNPFEAVASGRKTYELRLHDEKRRTISVGDEIVFTRTTDDATVHVRVTSLHPFPDFAALYAEMPLLSCGYTQENVHRANPRDMEAYYPPEKQAQHGVLAIGIERIRYPLHRMNGAYEVRELTDDDAADMLRLAEGNPLYYEHMRMTPTLENLRESLCALPPKRTAADKHFFGWFSGGRLIAMMDLISHYPKADMAFIGWFIVDAAHQGCGLGRRLVSEVLALLAEEGVQEVRLGRVSGNPQSERFWKVCGFEDNGLGYDTDGYSVAVMARKTP